MSRLLAALTAALLATVALAGCTSDEAPGATPSPSPTAPAPGDGGTTPPPADEQPAPTPRADVVNEDAGTVQGPFEKSWTVSVPAEGYQSVLARFALTGAQPGAPVTARVYVAFSGPDGTFIKGGTVGLGGSGDTLEYTFSPNELPPGEYMLTATAEPQQGGLPGVPSFGIANYAFYALTDY